MRIVLVEPYYGGSHRAWADGWRSHSSHDIRLVTHDDRFWRWRLRGSSLTLAASIRDAIAEDGQPDGLVVSGMVDLAAMLGFLRGTLAPEVPVVLYLHESQLLHPIGPRQRGDDDGPAYAQWLSMAVADRTVFNSSFHRDALVDALPDFLDRAPDHSHRGHVDEVFARTEVLPVGVDVRALVDGSRAGDGGPPLIVWNQRWDHDKDPARFVGVLGKLAEHGVAFRLALAGENGRSDPQELDAAITALGDRVVHVGHLPRDEYLELLLQSDVVVSTARHEFFGIAIVEAVSAGCVPLLPDRLSYPELVPEHWHDACLYRSGLFDRLCAVLTDIDGARVTIDGIRESMMRFDWSTLAPRYDALLQDTRRRVVP